MQRLKRVGFTLGLLVFAVACPRPESQDERWAEEALDSTEIAKNEAAIFIAGIDGADMNMTAVEVATNAETTATGMYQPSDCVTASRVDAVITYELDNCTGPFGLANVTGTITVTFSLVTEGIKAEAVATGLFVGGSTMDINATGIYSVANNKQTLVVDTTGDGTGPRGVSFVRNGSYTLSWDTYAGCATLDGTWSTQVLGRTWSTTVDGFSKCQDRCPAAGGTIKYTGGLSGVTVNVNFDGSATANWDTTRGEVGQIALFCIPG
jgi:hypothetical protein